MLEKLFGWGNSKKKKGFENNVETNKKNNNFQENLTAKKEEMEIKEKETGPNQEIISTTDSVDKKAEEKKTKAIEKIKEKIKEVSEINKTELIDPNGLYNPEAIKKYFQEATFNYNFEKKKRNEKGEWVKILEQKKGLESVLDKIFENELTENNNKKYNFFDDSQELIEQDKFGISLIRVGEIYEYGEDEDKIVDHHYEDAGVILIKLNDKRDRLLCSFLDGKEVDAYYLKSPAVEMNNDIKEATRNILDNDENGFKINYKGAWFEKVETKDKK